MLTVKLDLQDKTIAIPDPKDVKLGPPDISTTKPVSLVVNEFRGCFELFFSIKRLATLVVNFIGTSR